MSLPLTCLSFGLSVSSVCLSVSQTSADNSGYKGTREIQATCGLEFKSSGCAEVTTLTMTQVLVCQSQSK